MSLLARFREWLQEKDVRKDLVNYLEEDAPIDPEIIKTHAEVVDEVLRQKAVFIPRYKPNPIKEITEQHDDSSIREPNIG